MVCWTVNVQLQGQRVNGFLPVSSIFWPPFTVFKFVSVLSICTQFHHLLCGLPLSRLPWGLLLSTWLNFLLLSILLTWAVQFNRPMAVYLSLQRAVPAPYYFASSSFHWLLIPLNLLLTIFRKQHLYSVSKICSACCHKSYWMSHRFLFYILWVLIDSLVKGEVNYFMYIGPCIIVIVEE